MHPLSIDCSATLPNNSVMSTETQNTGGIPADILADGEAVIQSIMAGRKPDAELARKIADRADGITEELRRRHRTVDTALEAIRALRDS